MITLSRDRRRSRRVMVIAHHGATAVMTPATARPEVISTIQQAFTPMVVDGQVVADLSGLASLVRGRRGLPAVDRTRSRRAVEVTNLNGVVLHEVLRRSGFEPVVVNDLAFDGDVLERSLATDVLAVVISTTFLPFR